MKKITIIILIIFYSCAKRSPHSTLDLLLNEQLVENQKTYYIYNQFNLKIKTNKKLKIFVDSELCTIKDLNSSLKTYYLSDGFANIKIYDSETLLYDFDIIKKGFETSPERLKLFSINLEKTPLKKKKEKKLTYLIYMSTASTSDPSPLVYGEIEDLVEFYDTTLSADMNLIVISNFRNTIGGGVYIKKGNKLVKVEDESLEGFEKDYNPSDKEGKNLELALSLMENYFPAKKYVLEFWGHGMHWESYNNSSISKNVIIDTRYKNSLNMKKVAMHLNTHPQITAKLELLYFDQCLQGSIESIYEFRNSAKFLLASPELVPSSGGEYYKSLNFISQNLDKTGEIWGQEILNNSYAINSLTLRGASYSLIDLKKSRKFFSEYFEIFLKEFEKIKRNNILDKDSLYKYGINPYTGYSNSTDSYSFGDILKKINDKTLNSAYYDMINTHKSRRMDGGLSIYFPDSTNIFYLEEYRKNTSFGESALGNRWLDLVR